MEKEQKEMTDEQRCKEKWNKKKRYNAATNSSNVVYGLGAIGAAVYFIPNAVGFWAGVLGILKAFVWPAILVFEALSAMSA